MKRDNAFTGLEAAIVLIAFVVVAAIFSYVMLGAGFFATQKAQEVTYASVKQTTSNIVPDGTIYGNMSGTTSDAKLELVQLSLSIPIGGQAQQFSDLMITYSREGQIPMNYNFTPLDTAKKPIKAADMEFGKFVVESCTSGTIEDKATSVLVSPGNSCNVILKLENGPKAGDWFQLEVKPPIGAPTTIRKTIPTGYNGGKLL